MVRLGRRDGEDARTDEVPWVRPFRRLGAEAVSFPALALAVDAAYAVPPLEDEEFGVGWLDLDEVPAILVDWVLYRSLGAGLILGVREARMEQPR